MKLQKNLKKSLFSDQRNQLSCIVGGLGFLVLVLASAPFAAVNYDTAWTFVYDGGRDSASGLVIGDQFFDVKALTNGVCVCVGRTSNKSLLVKLANDGTILQKTTYTTNHSFQLFNSQSLHTLALSSNGDFLVGGERFNSPIIMRLNSDGDIVWSTWYYDSTKEVSGKYLNRSATINSLLETPSGKIVCAAGDEFPNNGGSTLQNYAAYLAFDSTGKLSNWGQWDRETGYNIGGFSIAIADTQINWMHIAGNQGLYTVDLNGNAKARENYTFWLEKVGTVTNKVMRSRRLQDGRMVVIGQSYEPDCWTKYSRYSWDAWWSVVTLTGSSMEADWVRHGVSGQDDKIFDCTQLIDGKLVFVGTKGGENGNSSVWTIVTDSTGKNVLFEDLFVKVVHQYAVMYPMAVTATPDSGFTVVGYGIVDTVSNWDAFAMHMVPTSGASVRNTVSKKYSEQHVLRPACSNRAISFTINPKESSTILLKVYNFSGKCVASINNTQQGTISWNFGREASGAYLYSLQTGREIYSGQILVRR